jgi:hypothetical protein
MNAIWADKTLLYKVDQRKIAFHSLETKRYTRRCAINTYAFGSVKIEIGLEMEEEELESDMADTPATLQELLT